ncbi:methyltransferase domain-containing protein [Amaricoccus solimangrovi]|uniref:Methyltransferase domain-containing protein n=1 Tax=Amaricoccus solimangrovi TaxID=2589815 RepID=A0A501WXP7_9RHOB|nr:methyltransferase domain-containing protein [Amaricoccus solimangrovi]TPE52237.1 methyltransferase domain-containing protein [Amaricoccus solimangrovi]
MPTPPALFDPDLLALRRARAEAGEPADFLREAAAAEIAERLSEVNRSFRAPVIIGPRGALWAEALGLPGARLIPDAEVLDLAEGEADLIVHALALHWANDPVGQLAQARRGLRPDGLFIAALFAGETLTELRRALAEAEVETTGGLSPRVAPMGEIRDLGGLLQRAGLALPVADSQRLPVSYATMFHLMRDLRAMGETSVLRERSRRPMPRALLARAAEIYAERFGDAEGRVGATFEIVYLTGWAPSPDQRKPLRPGSAAARLADALGTEEHGAGERAGDARVQEDRNEGAGENGTS